MKARLVALIGGLLGTAGLLCFLLAFATDYWLLARHDCNAHIPGGAGGNDTQVNSTSTVPTEPQLWVHHEGFFWRCRFHGDASLHVVWGVLFTNQLSPKVCVRGYLFPLPVAVGPVPHTVYDTTTVFRGFWTLLVMLGVVTVVTGSCLLLCAVPFINAKLYRVAGVLLLTSAGLFLALLCLFVLWKELLEDVRTFVLQEHGDDCPVAQLDMHYGWSFMLGAAGVPLVFLSGQLFYCIGTHTRRS